MLAHKPMLPKIPISIAREIIEKFACPIVIPSLLKKN